MTRQYLTVFVLAYAAMILSADGQVRLDPAHPMMSVYSPFSRIIDDMLDAHTAVSATKPVPFICPIIKYYSESGTNRTYEETPPTTQWAIRLTLPSGNVAPPCTVWTVQVDFELSSSNQNRDTIQFFLREAAAPYTQIFTTYYLARTGENVGEYEIAPPPQTNPPTVVWPIIGFPKRDMYVGYYVRGDTSHRVKWKFKQPSVNTNPVRSMAFTSPTTVVPASTIVGYSADWVSWLRLCCNYFPPVELSLFTAEISGDEVHLSWKTESETNNFQFEILRATSPEGPWESRGFVPGRGTLRTPQWYTFTDILAGMAERQYAGTLFYRLRQTDFDGNTDDGPILRVTIEDPTRGNTRLYPIFPNPFRPEISTGVVFRYDLRKASTVRLTIHDPLGREVAVLANGTEEEGFHQALWTPRSTDGLTAGTYFARLVADDMVSTTLFSVIR
ncbi:MAG: T9SS type A sorting domain-containing protein [Bacteroidota bacterium]|nr:T9SS type A sorting domain-containing protein [Bacteroidota bacterium]